MWLIKDKNETEYIAPDGADFTKITEDLTNALSLIITGRFKGNLTHFPNLRKLYIAEDAYQDSGVISTPILSKENKYIEEIVNNSTNIQNHQTIKLGITTEHTNLKYVKTWRLGYSGVQNAPNIQTLVYNIQNSQQFINNQSLVNLEINASIYKESFKGCSKLSNVILNSGVASVGDNAFEGCPIKSIHVPSSIGEYTFKDCKYLTDVSISGNIGANAFEGCSKLSNVILNSGVASVGDNAFNNCGEFDIITSNSFDFSSAITGDSFANIYFIGTKADLQQIDDSGTNYVVYFYSESKPTEPGLYWHYNKFGQIIQWDDYNYSLLEYKLTTNYEYEVVGIGQYSALDVYIPQYLRGKAVTSIAPKAFENTNISNVYIENSNIEVIGEGAFQNCKKLINIILPTKLTEISSDTFAGCQSLETIQILSNIKKICKNAFKDCTALTGVYIQNIDDWCTIDFDSDIGTDPIVVQNTNPLYYAKKLYINNNEIINITITASTITDYALYNCQNVEDIIIENGATIGFGSFKQCSSVKSISIPTIGTEEYRYFGYIFGAKSAEENNNFVPKLLIGVTITNDKEVPEKAFYNCTNIKQIELNDNISKFKDYSFANCINLEELNIPNSLNEIEEYAFNSATKILTKNISNNIYYLHSWVIGCNLNNIRNKRVEIKDDTNGIINALFKDLYLDTLKIPESIDYINTSLNNCKVQSAIIPNPFYTHIDTDSLEYLTITGRGNITTQLKQAEIIELTIGSKITSIGAQILPKPNALQGLFFEKGSQLNTITQGAFSGCNQLQGITLPFIGGNKNATESSASTCFGYIFGNEKYEDSTEIKQNYGHLTNEPEKIVTYYIPTKLKIVTILGGFLGSGAFSDCKTLTTITIENSNNLCVPRFMFYNCSALTNITLNNEPKLLGFESFYLCTALKNITIPNSVIRMENSVFVESGLTTIKFEEEITGGTSKLNWIGVSCFKGLSITQINIPDSTWRIQHYAFSSCKNLTAIGLDPTGRWFAVKENPYEYFYVSNPGITDLNNTYYGYDFENDYKSKNPDYKCI